MFDHLVLYSILSLLTARSCGRNHLLHRLLGGNSADGEREGKYLQPSDKLLIVVVNLAKVTPVFMLGAFLPELCRPPSLPQSARWERGREQLHCLHSIMTSSLLTFQRHLCVRL